jgi:hypothetical protein
MQWVEITGKQRPDIGVPVLVYIPNKSMFSQGDGIEISQRCAAPVRDAHDFDCIGKPSHYAELKKPFLEKATQ